jgi:hypothetical protein
MVSPEPRNPIVEYGVPGTPGQLNMVSPEPPEPLVSPEPPEPPQEQMQMIIHHRKTTHTDCEDLGELLDAVFKPAFAV